MSLARLLAASLLLCPVSALSQDSRIGINIVGPLSSRPGLYFWRLGTAATALEPWRLIPSQTDVSSEGSALNRLRIDDYEVFRSTADGRVRLSLPNPDAGVFDPILKQQREADSTCYSIRSYVVARDSKDSDSTHPAGYSTCQPTDRYRLKSTEIRAVSPDR